LFFCQLSVVSCHALARYPIPWLSKPGIASHGQVTTDQAVALTLLLRRGVRQLAEAYANKTRKGSAIGDGGRVWRAASRDTVGEFRSV
jgi:hypothetical protein